MTMSISRRVAAGAAAWALSDGDRGMRGAGIASLAQGAFLLGFDLWGWVASDANAERFVRALRSAVVMINASSRFSDGGELGLGAEIGISTTRLHAYGPMGLEALTVERFVVRGEGQTRNIHG